MRPRRILRRLIARARHWGDPHVHCPACGADVTVPGDTGPQTCFTCRTEWFRQDLTGDDQADWEVARGRIPEGREWAITWRPLLVDVPDPGGGKRTQTLDSLFVFLLAPDS